MELRARISAKLWISRAFYLADLIAGVAQGSYCPSCHSGQSNALRSPARRIGFCHECRNCGLYFRPTGLQRGPIPELYYSRFYKAGLATSDQAVSTPELRDRLVEEEGKNRDRLVRTLIGPPNETGEIAVFGCSWGYEVSELQRAGYSAFGIELSRKRRGWGQRRLGLSIYETAAAAAAAGHTPAVVISSHVLEHIPDVELVLDDLQDRLRPRLHLHITPFADDFRTNPERARIIGREHPLGITAGFWQYWCARHGFGVDARQGGGVVDTASWELVTTIFTGGSRA